MRVSVIVFPGSVGSEDAAWAFDRILGTHVSRIWHQDSDLQKPDLVIIPGGAAFGDCLRPGALARLSPILDAIDKHARRGGYVLGIGNGFQICCERGLLPGCLLINPNLQFNAQSVFVRAESNKSPFLHNLIAGDVLCLPICHRYGRYFVPDQTLEAMEAAGQIALRYATPDGEVSAHANPNASRHAIAGVCDSGGHVLGLMPHPERHVDNELGSEDGLALLSGIVDFLAMTRS